MTNSISHKALASALALATFFGAEAAFAQVAPAAEPGQAPAGFALQASVINVPIAIDDDLLGFNTLEAGLMLGYKFDRVIVGVGFGFLRYSDTHTVDIPESGLQPYSTTRTYYSLAIYPELQVALARTADRKAELFGALSVGLGTWDSETVTDDPNNPTPTPEPNDNEMNLRVRWRAAPGVRYWVHPHIGVSLSAGLAGNHQINERDETANGGTKTSNTLGLISFDTQLGFVGVF